MRDPNDSRNAAPFVTPPPQTEVDSELAFHLEQRIQKYIASGMTPEEARRTALERFGDVDGVRRECEQLLTEDRRAEARRNWWDDLTQDIRFAIRSAARAPLFSLLAVATLALGIGANAAVFGVVKSVLLNSLPYRDAGRLMRIYAPVHDGTQPRGSLSAGTVSDIRERQHSFASFGAFMQSRDVTYMGEDGPHVMKAMWAEPSLFRTLGVSPIAGPGFQDADGMHDTSLVVMLPNATWQRLFGGDRGVIGRAIQVNGIPRTIVGILPRDFVAPEGQADFYFALGMPLFMTDPISVRGSHNFGFVGRLKPGVDAAQAKRELTRIGADLERQYAKDNLGIGLSAVSLRDSMVGDTRTPLLVLLASAALVLLIMCANLAGALLSRTISRGKEFAVRVALGAGRGRLVRQLLTESILLSLAGGLAGVLLASIALRLLRHLALTALPAYAGLSLDTTAVLVTFALALLTGLAFGVGPALSVSRSDPQGTLREQTRGTSESARSRRMRGVLVAGQIALCVSLLAAAGLLARTLWAMTSASPGFDPQRLLTFRVQLPAARYPTPGAIDQFYDEFEAKLGALPGVTGTAITAQLPTQIQNSNGFFVENRPWAKNQPVPFILTSIVSEDYFRTLRIPLVQGRTFTVDDRPGAPVPIIINQAMAERYWPRQNPIGARIHIGPPNPSAPWITIVGVVGNVRNDPTHLRPEPMMFLPIREEAFGDTYIVRTTGDPLALTAAARRALAAIDPKLPMHDVSTMRDVMDDGLATRRLPVVLMSAFGALALILASVGIYAMFASMAAAREREFGVRVALGSTRSQIAALVLRQGAVWMAAGLCVGAVGVVIAGRLLRSQLFGIPEFDPVAIGIALAVLIVCAGFALLVPVRRASRVDPIHVLR
jgi:predicted permease